MTKDEVKHQAMLAARSKLIAHLNDCEKCRAAEGTSICMTALTFVASFTKAQKASPRQLTATEILADFKIYRSLNYGFVVLTAPELDTLIEALTKALEPPKPWITDGSEKP